MKRTATLKRRRPLERKAAMGLERRTRVRKVNRGRKAKRWAESFGTEARVQLINSFPCLLSKPTFRTFGTWWDVETGRTEPMHQCAGPTQNAHVRSRGAGGTARDVVPLCAFHHREQHDKGVRDFERKYGLDLAAEAARTAEVASCRLGKE